MPTPSTTAPAPEPSVPMPQNVSLKSNSGRSEIESVEYQLDLSANEVWRSIRAKSLRGAYFMLLIGILVLAGGSYALYAFTMLHQGQVRVEGIPVLMGGGIVGIWFFATWSRRGANRVRVGPDGVDFWYPGRKHPRSLAWESPRFSLRLRKTGTGLCYESNFVSPNTMLTLEAWMSLLENSRKAGMDVRESTSWQGYITTVRIGPRKPET